MRALKQLQQNLRSEAGAQEKHSTVIRVVITVLAAITQPKGCIVSYSQFKTKIQYRRIFVDRSPSYSKGSSTAFDEGETTARVNITRRMTPPQACKQLPSVTPCLKLCLTTQAKSERCDVITLALAPESSGTTFFGETLGGQFIPGVIHVAVRTSALETAVIQLCNLAPSEKRPLMQALAYAAEHDGIVSVAQAELLRAIGDSLDCPLPPLLADGSNGTSS